MTADLQDRFDQPDVRPDLTVDALALTAESLPSVPLDRSSWVLVAVLACGTFGLMVLLVTAIAALVPG